MYSRPKEESNELSSNRQVGLQRIEFYQITSSMKKIDAQILDFDARKYGSNLLNLREFDNNRIYRFAKGDIADHALV